MMFKESDVLELKESLQLRDEIGKAVSAFANSGKGKILVGVTDEGKVLGVQLGRKTLHDLVNFIKENTECESYIKQHIAMMSRQSPFKVQRDDIPEYGLFSIRELITNAVCHRDYENQHTKVIVRMFDKRIEVDNPGGLPNHITPENILSKQFSRNPTISKVLTKVGYIEDLGEGWNKIIKEYKRHLLKPRLPLIEADNFSTVITLFSAKDKFVSHEELGEKVGRRLSKNESRIIDEIAKDKYVTIKMLSEELGLSTTAIENNIKKLKNKKLLSRVGSDKGGRWELAKR